MLGGVMVGLGAVGWVISLLVDSVKAADPDKELTVNPFSGLAESLARVRADRTLSLALLAYAFLWLIGTVLTLNINVYGMEVLGLGKALTSLLPVTLAMLVVITISTSPLLLVTKPHQYMEV